MLTILGDSQSRDKPDSLFRCARERTAKTCEPDDRIFPPRGGKSGPDPPRGRCDPAGFDGPDSGTVLAANPMVHRCVRDPALCGADRRLWAQSSRRAAARAGNRVRDHRAGCGAHGCRLRAAGGIREPGRCGIRTRVARAGSRRAVGRATARTGTVRHAGGRRARRCHDRRQGARDAGPHRDGRENHRPRRTQAGFRQSCRVRGARHPPRRADLRTVAGLTRPPAGKSSAARTPRVRLGGADRGRLCH